MSEEAPLIDTSDMQRVGGQLGSNPAGIYEDENGRRYYVKTLESAAHARNEYLAAMLYRLAGAPTLNYLHTTAPAQVATEWLELDKRCVAHLSDSERKQARQWFGVHAWTANWDAAGYDGDNQGVVNGVVLTLDVGGALAFRAHGDPKGRAFGKRVSDRLLAVHILASPQCLQTDQRVPVIGCRDDHGVQIVSPAQLAIVRVGRRTAGCRAAHYH